MSESCCSTSNSKKPLGKTFCPQCGAQGRPVQRITLGALLIPGARKRLPRNVTFLFCSSANCDVAYFAPDTKPFLAGDLTVRVGQKVKEGPKPVCYCFGYSEETILEDVAKNRGTTNIPAKITVQVKAGNCFCEVTNPQGSCCLGNVNQVIQKGRAK